MNNQYCTFSGSIALPETKSCLVRCPVCGAYRFLIARQFKGDRFQFPRHLQKFSRHTDLPSWQLVDNGDVNSFASWKWIDHTRQEAPVNGQ